VSGNTAIKTHPKNAYTLNIRVSSVKPSQTTSHFYDALFGEKRDTKDVEKTTSLNKYLCISSRAGIVFRESNRLEVHGCIHQPLESSKFAFVEYHIIDTIKGDLLRHIKDIFITISLINYYKVSIRSTMSKKIIVWTIKAYIPLFK
jgi:hypothetical protein